MYYTFTCGSITKEGEKGFKDRNCGVCREREEHFEHMWVCDKARKIIKEKIVREADRKNNSRLEGVTG